MVVRELRIAIDAVALIVNTENEESIIGIPTLKRILTGEITEWRELNPRSNLGKIDVIFDNPNSSTVRFAIDSICGGQELSGNLYAQKNNMEVIEKVAEIPGALGIIGVNWISNDNDSTNMSFSEKIKVLAVGRYANPDRFNSFEPFQAFIALRQYPMTRNVYILLSDPRNGLSSGFASFIASDRGQRIILKSGLVPATMPINIINVHDRNPR
jgi:phosphate transport system substrate-binding protein